MGAVKTGLLITDQQVLSEGTIEKFKGSREVGPFAVSVITQSSKLDSGKLSLNSAAVDSILSISERPGHHSASLLADYARVLRPGGFLILQEPVAKRLPVAEEAVKLGPSASALQSQATIERALLLAGFIGTTVTSPVIETGLSTSYAGLTPAFIGSTHGPLLQPIAIQSQKPAWASGSSFSLKRKTGNVNGLKEAAISESNGFKPNNKGTVRLSMADMVEVNVSPAPALAKPAIQVATSNATAASSTSRKLMLSDAMGESADINDADELIDEDSLLTAEDLAPPAAVPNADECGPASGKKACKNCSCGRAEMEALEETQKLTLDQVNNPQSACGSCGLGDAFRCAGCPYRGLPAFKLGEKIFLSGSQLVTDV